MAKDSYFSKILGNFMSCDRRKSRGPWTVSRGKVYVKTPFHISFHGVVSSIIYLQKKLIITTTTTRITTNVRRRTFVPVQLQLCNNTKAIKDTIDRRAAPSFIYNTSIYMITDIHLILWSTLGRSVHT